MIWLRRGPRIDVDLPVSGAEAERSVLVAGWAFSRGSTIRSVEVVVGEEGPVLLRHDLPRPDVAAVHGCEAACGFEQQVSIEGQPAGPVALRIVALDADGRRAERVSTVMRRESPRAAQPPPPARPVLPPRDPGDGLDAGQLSRFLQAARSELGRDPSLLDATGFGLAARLPGELVVTPLDAALPYLDHTFDVVVLDAARPERLARAQELAERMVILMRRDGACQTRPRAGSGGPRPPRVSVVIPVFEQSACTDACLERVLATWPAGQEGEVLVVDDGSGDDTPQVLARWSARDPRVRVLRQPENRGFVAACNAGAAAAHGEVLVFLNNDTLPRPDWLPPLLDLLRRERVGAVGGKLLYPDGSLQEAGGVIFSDGAGCNFGKGDPQPDDPLYDHVREVDYCSGALLATPRSLFVELGGFDPVYAPAYYEDTDYAFRLRQRGFRVLYQPAAAIVHLEGATAGRDLGAGVKSYQVRNRGRFVERWSGALTSQPEHPRLIDRPTLHRLARRGSARRALVVVPTMPEPDRESGSRRAFHLIELLVEAGWGVSLLVENATGGVRCARALRQLGVATYSGRHTSDAGADHLPDLAALLVRESFDLALLAFWYVAEHYLPTLRALAPQARLLADSIDLHFLRGARTLFSAATQAGRQDALDGRFADEMRRELNAYAAADGVLTVSPREASWIDDLLARPGHALCVPDLEDPRAPQRGRETRRGLLFVGNFRHPPNVDALGLLAEIVGLLDPELLAEQPLSIVGNALQPAMLGRLGGHPHVRTIGWVPAVEPYLEQALLTLVPLRHGAGTKRKLFQSLLAGTPCVSTPVGVEGMVFVAGREVVVAADPRSFAEAVAQLVRDPGRWQELSRRGRVAAERHHGRAAVREQFAAALETVSSRPRR